MTKLDPPATITVAGKEYPVSGFSETVQKLIQIHTEWRSDLNSEQLAVAKTQAAIRALDAELTAAVQAELNPKPAPAPVDAPAANDAPAATDAPAAPTAQ